jgi:hypothetical protein
VTAVTVNTSDKRLVEEFQRATRAKITESRSIRDKKKRLVEGSGAKVPA